MALKGALRRAEVCWTMSMLSVRRPRRKGRWARQTRATTACQPRGMHSSRRSTCLHRRPRPRERRPPAQEADPVRSSRRVSCCRRGRRRRARCSTRAPCPLASVPRCLASLPREWSRLGAYLRCGVECAGFLGVKSTGGAKAAVVGLLVGARRASLLTRAGLARPGRRASGDLWRDLGEDGGRSGFSLGAVGGVDVSVGEHCFSKRACAAQPASQSKTSKRESGRRGASTLNSQGNIVVLAGECSFVVVRDSFDRKERKRIPRSRCGGAGEVRDG